MDFRVGPWLVRPRLNSLVRGGQACHVTPKAMEVLVCLAKREGEVVGKDEIFQEVWAGTFVSDDSLTRCIGELRRAFRDTAREPAVIETIAKRGYRILAPVAWDDGGTAPGPDAAPTAGAPLWKRRWRVAGGVFILALAILLLLNAGRLRRGAPVIRSVAVLPLLNLSGDPEQEYFSDGMTDALTADLAKLRSLRVISRTSAMSYKGTRKPVPAIARELNVDALVEGSVMRAGERVRITVQLIQASTDTHLWAATYERDVRDALRLQGEVAQAIAREIGVAVTPAERARLAARPPVKPEAYEAYLKGMFHLNKFTVEGFGRGMAHLQQAVEKDPADSFAYGALALGYSIMGHDRFPDAFARAKAAARKSLELGGPLAEAHAALGMEELYSAWNLSSAGQELGRALELNPNFAEAHRHYSWYLRLLGRYEEGLAEMKRAEELEPLVPLFPADLAWQYFEQGQVDAASAAARRSLELNPSFAEGLAVAGWIYTQRGMYDQALAAHQKAAGADPAWKWPLGRTYALLGRKDEARKIAAEMAKQPGPMEQWGLAVIYAALGEKDQAFRWLEAAYKSRFSWMPWIADFSRLEVDLFTPLRGDPRFGDLTRRIGVPSGASYLRFLCRIRDAIS